jgi:hypothetical protein
VSARMTLTFASPGLVEIAPVPSKEFVPAPPPVVYQTPVSDRGRYSIVSPRGERGRW